MHGINNIELSSLEETRCQFNGGTGAIKLGIDVHQDFYVVVEQVGGSNPKPPQRFAKEAFLHWAARLKQKSSAKPVSVGAVHRRLILVAACFTRQTHILEVVASGSLCCRKVDSARLWNSNEPSAMTLIEVRPHRWGWKVFEAPGVEPVFPEKGQAIDYAQCRASFRSGEIRILDATGKLERTIPFNEADRML